MNIIAVGDFFQLPPVHAPLACKNPLWSQFEGYNLQQNQRQCGDATWTTSSTDLNIYLILFNFLLMRLEMDTLRSNLQQAISVFREDSSAQLEVMFTLQISQMSPVLTYDNMYTHTYNDTYT